MVIYLGHYSFSGVKYKSLIWGLRYVSTSAL